jgi:cell division protein FtsB
MKWFVAALASVLLLLQYRLWISTDGLSEVLRLKSAVGAQQADNLRLSERNRQLSAEVHDLKQGYVALEERARTDLGMIGSNETFFQVLPPEAGTRASPDAPPSAPTAPAAPSAAPPAAPAHTAAR